MRYVVIRRTPPAADAPDRQRAKRAPAKKAHTDFAGVEAKRPATQAPKKQKNGRDSTRAESHNFDSGQAAKERQRDDVDAVALAMPLTLIKPLSTQSGTPAAKAWGLEATKVLKSPYSGKGVTIAILDTGIDENHAAFKHIRDRMTLMDFTGNNTGVLGTAPDTDGHGTHVAGTLFGKLAKGPRIGIAPDAKRVLVGKILGGKGASYDSCYNAIEWAVREGADVISLSVGLNFEAAVKDYMATDELPEDIAIARALEAYRQSLDIFESMAKLIRVRNGALLIAAAGNDSRRQANSRFTIGAVLPSSAEGFIPVGAVQRTRVPASPHAVSEFSNTECDLCGPGEDILSAKLGGDLVTMGGTSMATPHVAGIAALWKEKMFGAGRPPAKWTEQVKQEMISHCKTLKGFARADVGSGLVQAPL